MQTIRIYQNGKLIHKESGIPGLVETEELRKQYPEPSFTWVR